MPVTEYDQLALLKSLWTWFYIVLKQLTNCMVGDWEFQETWMLFSMLVGKSSWGFIDSWSIAEISVGKLDGWSVTGI